MKNPTCIAAALTLLISLLCSTNSTAGDWPTWRHDAGRSGVTDEQLPANLQLQWTRKLPQLKPAWPEDIRLQFDDSYQPIVVGKLMIVASSHNDSVTAYDTDSGDQLWRFFANAPIRFAPAAHGSSVYFGADDGHLYQLDTKSGQLISKLNATPSDRTALGNERLISVWPIRGGPVIVDDTIHFTVGVWPFEGTYLSSLKLKDGAALAPLTPLDNSTPQGYLATNGSTLVIPAGRANAICRDLNSGENITLSYSARGLTDHHIVVLDQWMFHGGKGVSFDKKNQLDFDAHRPLVSNDKVYFSRGGQAHAYDLKNIETVEKVDRRGKSIKVKAPKLLWKFPEQVITALHLKTANRLYGHDKNTIFAIDEPQGDDKAKVSFTAPIEGTCSSMLAADGKLFVVTTQGRIYCYGPNKIASKKHSEENTPLLANKEWSEKAGAILEQTEVKGGYCLALGIGSGGLIEELVRQSQLTVITIDPDAEKVDTFRRRMDKKGLYGTRIVAIKGTIDDLRLPPYLASLLVSEDIQSAPIDGNNIQRAFRTLRPYGGVACLEMTDGQHLAFAETAAKDDLPNAVIGRNTEWTTFTRQGALPGAANWTHEYGDASNTLTSHDRLVKAPMGVLWFGGPASDGDLFYNRHYWGPSATIIDGRMFIQGPGKLTAVDVYTGRILWKIALKEKAEIRAGRRGNNFEKVLSGFHFVASEDGLYIVDGREIIRIDPITGAQLGLFTHPDDDVDVEWGRPLIHGDLLIVSVFRDTDIFGRLPTELVALDKRSGEIRWTKKAKLSFPVFALGGDKLFCFDGAIEEFYDTWKRRGVVPTAMADKFLRAIDLKTGKDLWEEPTDLVATWLSYSGEQDVMVVSNKEKVAAFRGETGKSLWRKYSEGEGFKGHPENYWDKVIIWKDRILDQRGPGQAYALETGDVIMKENPFTGKSDPWSFTKSGHHCNYAIASEHLMTFRAADAGFADLETGSTGRFVGFRSGCRNSLIPANGVLNAPNFSHGCNCSYSLFTSLALMHIPESDLWTYSANKAGDGPLQKLGINFGGRGDRTAENGTQWIDYPSVGGSSPVIPIKVEMNKGSKAFRLPSTQVDGDGLNWVAASGFSDVKSITIPTVVGKVDGKPANRSFTVRLSFVEPEKSKAGQRTFDVLIQGKPVLQDFDLFKEADGIRRILVKEFRGIKAAENISITFVSKAGPALISGVEIEADGN